MRRYAAMHELDIWYDGTEVYALRGLLRAGRRGRVKVYIEKRKDKRTSRGAFPKLTTMAHGRPRISTEPPLRVRLSDAEQDEIVAVLLAGYRLTLQEDRRTLFDRFVEADTVRQVVGVGSVGMTVYLVLLEGRWAPTRSSCNAGRPDPRSTRPTCVPPSTPITASGSSPASGWCRAQPISSSAGVALDGRDFYVRQYRDMKLIPTTEMIAQQLARFAAACGSTLGPRPRPLGGSLGHRRLHGKR